MMHSEPEPVSAEIAELLHISPACRAWAEQDQGPFHRDDEPVRRDLAEDREGAPLALGIRLAGPDGTPLGGAAVEVWHCDALGRYSGFPPPEPTGTVAQPQYLPGETFLRGRQITDAAGMVEFRTIYPGWYPGRTVHIHTMVHASGATLTTQLYFLSPSTMRSWGPSPTATGPGGTPPTPPTRSFPPAARPPSLR